MSDPFSPGLEDVIATDTTISVLDTEAEQIVVRGYDLIELATRVRYPDVAYLLLHDDLPTLPEQRSFCAELRQNASIPRTVTAVLEALPPAANAMDALRTGLSALATTEDPAVLDDPSHEPNLAKAVRILSRAPAVAVNAYRATHELEQVTPDPDLGFSERFLAMIPGAAADPTSVAVFDRILICYAEHELASSTLAARVVASSLADVYGAVVAATASLKGPLHGGANEAAARMFAEIAERGGPEEAQGWILERLSSGRKIMGFGHRVYMHRPDPRAVLLKGALDAMAARDAETAATVRTYEICTRTMEREKGLHPNADLPIGLLLSLLGIPIELFTPIFLCARTAGLLAHVIEQHDHNRLYRPRVLYRGPRDRHPEAGFRPSPC